MHHCRLKDLWCYSQHKTLKSGEIYQKSWLLCFIISFLLFLSFCINIWNIWKLVLKNHKKKNTIARKKIYVYEFCSITFQCVGYLRIMLSKCILMWFLFVFIKLIIYLFIYLLRQLKSSNNLLAFMIFYAIIIQEI